ncbi:MAG: hypothetical protein B7Y99_08090 [Caulobacterales bacterium 32-69-10]|nr:MAG: hypothetical protein B7Y99_08090 [Caulobacterales bacterium 32-69-10]
MTNRTDNPQHIAFQWKQAGGLVVPIHRELGRKPWNEDAPEYDPEDFVGGWTNVGVKCGLAPLSLADVDLDWIEAREAANAFLPKTQAVAGRSSSAGSHWLYRSPGARYVKFALPSVMKDHPLVRERPHALCIAEILGAGRLANAPGGRHHSGERYEWQADVEFPEIAEVHFDDLTRAVAHLYLAGALLELGFDAERGDEFALALAQADGDEEAVKRPKCKAADRRREAGEPVAGLAGLCTVVGWPDEMARVIRKWFGVAASTAVPDDKIVAGLNERYAVVSLTAGATIMRRAEVTSRFGVKMTAWQFRSESNLRLETKPEANIPARGKRVQHSDIWLQSADRRYCPNGFSFAVGEPPIGTLNLFSGFGVEPVEGDWTLIRRHIEEVIANGDPAMADYIIKWCGWAVQNPERPAEVGSRYDRRPGHGEEHPRQPAGRHGGQPWPSPRWDKRPVDQVQR